MFPAAVANPPATIAEGSTVWAVRMDPDEAEDHWTSFVVAAPVAPPGASGTVYAIDKATNPPLCVKLYNDELLDRIRTEDPFAQRITALANHSLHLHQELPFALWPRRLVFSVNKPSGPDQIRATMLGFTMARLVGTTSLLSLIRDDSARVRITPQNTAHIAITLADQLARLHRHQWGFVFGDMSPNNIHVTHDFNKVVFIDTDAFQFDYNNGAYGFRVPGLTPTYKSPGAENDIRSTGRVTTAHDDFVLAILIFQLLIAQAGFTSLHPFSSMDQEEDDLIQQRRFPYDDPATYPVPPEALAAYKALPDEVRGAFTRAFTASPPPTAAEWVRILSDYRRCLQ